MPVIAAFAGAAGAVAAAGGIAALGTLTVASVAAYASIAGAALTAVGAITGKKSLSKIGAVLSIGGGVASFAAGLADAAGQAAAAGTASVETAGDTASAALDAASKEASDLASGAVVSNAAGDAALTGTEAAGSSGASAGLQTGTDAAQPWMAPSAAENTGSFAQQALNAANGGAPSITTGGADGLGLNMSAANPTGSSGSLFDAASPYTAATAGNVATPTDYSVYPNQTPNEASRLDQIAQRYKATDVQSFFDKAKQMGGAVGDWVQKNPQLVKIGGDMLNGMFGPEAEQLDLQKSIYARRQRNLNTPIRMVYTTPGTMPKIGG